MIIRLLLVLLLVVLSPALVVAEPEPSPFPAYDDGVHTELQAAAWLGDRDRVRTLLESGAEVDEVDNEHGATPLMFAAAGGHLEIIEMLLASGADPSARSFHDAPPISYATMYHQHDAAALLLAAGVDVNEAWGGGTTPFLDACHQGDVAMMSLLLEAGADLTARYKGGVCALSSAAISGNSDAVRMLIDLGLTIEATNRHGSSPLMFAAINGNADAMRVLLEAGAQVDGARENGDTPLLRASGAGCVECVELLLNAGAAADARNADGMNAVLYAAWYGQPGVLDALMAGGVSLHNANSKGRTALAYAATYGHPEVVAKLLELGAEVDPADVHGRTPLMHAARVDCEPCVVELLGAGADFTLRSESGHAALDHAVIKGSDASAQTMIRAGILDRAPQEQLDRLLQESVGNQCSRETVSLILGLGADPNSKGEHERTPLHFAAGAGNADAIELLLEAGADVYAKDRHSAIPIMLANRTRPRADLEKSILLLAHAGPKFMDHAEQRHLRAWFRPVVLRMSLDSFEELVEVSGCLAELEDSFLQDIIQGVGTSGDIGRLSIIAANVDAERTARWVIGAAVSGATRAVGQGYKADDLKLLPDYSAFTVAWPNGRTPLHDRDVTEQAIDFAVALGVDPNAEDERGNRPLYSIMSSRKEGSVVVLRRLLEAGAEPDRVNQRSIAIDRAIRSGDVESMRVLLELGADPRACLHASREQAISRRIVEASRYEGMLELLFDAGLDLNEGDKAYPALHSLVRTTSGAANQLRRASHPNALQSARDELDTGIAGIGRMISAGFDIESRDSQGRTPLMFATDFEIFALLLEKGANIEAVNSEGAGILEAAVRGQIPYDPRVLVFLCQQKSLWDRAISHGINPLAGVVASGDLEALERVLVIAPDIDAVDERGQTALFAAARQYAGALLSRYQSPHNQFDEDRLSTALTMFEHLLKAGARTDVVDKSGQTPLHGMVDIPIVRLLVDHGCDVNARDVSMQTPLLSAARRRDAISLRALLDFGADPLLTDANGRMAIDYLPEPADPAAHGGNQELHEAYRRVYWRLKQMSVR